MKKLELNELSAVSGGGCWGPRLLAMSLGLAGICTVYWVYGKERAEDCLGFTNISC